MTFYRLLPILFTVSTASAQMAVPAHSFGEGMVTIGWYSFPPGDKTARDPGAILNISNVYSSTYFIKQDKVLRKDGLGTETKRDSSVNRITVEIEHPSYLIDWNERKVYKFQDTSNNHQAAGENLQEETREIFYRAMDDNTAVILSEQKDSPVYIAHMKCFKGLAKDKEDVFAFFYTEIPAGVRSPLNGFLPSDFPYNIMRVELPTEFSAPDGKSSKAMMVFQVLAIKECRLPDKLFYKQ